MNITNFNITSFSDNLSNIYTGDLPSKCLIKGNQYSLECIHQTICSQFNQHFIKLGLIIIAIDIIMGWFLWYFMNYGYKKFNWENNKGIWNLNYAENRIYIDNWIRIRIHKFCIGYIAMVVYLSWHF